MTAYPAWTPAPRPGIVPLHPYGFGVILGRSFTALRHNPAVLLGFALGVQAVAYVVLVLATGAVAFASFSRLDTLAPGSEDFEAVTAGSFALTGATALVLSLAAGALSALVQGVVVTEVAHAVVAEKAPLGRIWRRVRPAAWRLLGYTLLLASAAVLVIGVLGAALVALGFVVLPLAIGLGVLVVLGLVPLSLWLSTKLLLVPAAIVLEGAGIGTALVRSWRLTRRRFWPTLGILVVISMTFGVVAQAVGVPLQLVGMIGGTILAPTGDPEAEGLVVLVATVVLTQIVTILVQCVALIVQSTASALVYVDCRMRHEGLDLDLMSYVERRDAGTSDLADPYRAHIGGPAPVRWAPPTPGHAAPVWSAAPPAPTPPAPAEPGPTAPAAPAPPSTTQWAAPGASEPERP